MEVNKFEIIDNFLPVSVHENIKNIFLNPNFPWYFNDSKSFEKQETEEDFIENFQFTHSFFNNYSIDSHNYWSLVFPLVEKLNPLSLIRIKANLTTVTSSVIKYGLHLDCKSPDYSNIKHMVGVYYVNSNNGKTVLEDNTEIDSVENRLLIMRGDVMHTATSCTDEKVRCVVNINYISKD